MYERGKRECEESCDDGRVPDSGGRKGSENVSEVYDRERKDACMDG